MSAAYVGKEAPSKAVLINTPAFHSLVLIEKMWGWDKFQGVLTALAATGRGVESAMVQVRPRTCRSPRHGMPSNLTNEASNTCR